MTRLATIPCPNCPRDLQFRAEYAGRKVACRFCGFLFRLPTRVVLNCPECRVDGLFRSEYLGRKIRCKACSHIFVAILKRPTVDPAATAPASAAGPPAVDARVERLHHEIARRDQALADALSELDDLRQRIAELQAQSPAPLADGEHDLASLTQEWAQIRKGEEDIDDRSAPHTQVDDRSAFSTEIDLPRIDDQATHAGDPVTLKTRIEDQDLARTEVGPLDGSSADNLALRLEAWSGEAPTQTTLVPEIDPIRTELGLAPGASAELVALREECEQLRQRLAALEEQDDRTLVSSDDLDILDRRLAVANADILRATSERDEAARLADELGRRLLEREAAMAEALRDHESALAQARREGEDAHARFDRLTSEHQALATDVQILRRDRDANAQKLERALHEQKGQAKEAEALRSERDGFLGRAQALAAELSAANAALEALRSAPAPAPVASHVGEEITPDQFYEMARERDQARRELARVRSVLDRLGGESPSHA